jgi:hypothetical protein
MADEASKGTVDLKFIPWDVTTPVVDPTDISEVDLAHKNLGEKIHFRNEEDLADPTAFFVDKETKIIPEKKKRPYEVNDCKVKLSSYSNLGKSKYNWWSDVLLAVRDNLTAKDLEKEFTLFVDFHGGGFVSIFGSCACYEVD